MKSYAKIIKYMIIKSIKFKKKIVIKVCFLLLLHYSMCSILDNAAKEPSYIPVVIFTKYLNIYNVCLAY